MSKFQVDFWVEARAKTSAYRFYPLLPAGELQMNLADVFCRLLELIEDGRLKVEFLKDKNYKSESDLIPLFSFTSEYIEFINGRGAKTYDLSKM
jgi:hypothetical protein